MYGTTGVHEYRSTGLQKYRRTGVLEYRVQGVSAGWGECREWSVESPEGWSVGVQWSPVGRRPPPCEHHHRPDPDQPRNKSQRNSQKQIIDTNPVRFGTLGRMYYVLHYSPPLK